MKKTKNSQLNSSENNKGAETLDELMQSQESKVKAHFGNVEMPKWEDRTNQQKVDSIALHYTKIIMANNRNPNAFYKASMSKDEITQSMPYNGATGRPYINETSIILRSVAQLNGYDEAVFLTAKQANHLGGSLKKEYDEQGNVKQTANGKDQYVRGVKIAYIKTEEFRPKLDANGQAVTRPIRNKEGQYLLDEKGEQVRRPVQELVQLKAPILETTTLYHISQFENLDLSKIKPRNLESIEKRRDYFAKNPDKEPQTKLASYGLFANITKDLNSFVKAEAKGLDYTRAREPKLLDMSAKKEYSLAR